VPFADVGPLKIESDLTDEQVLFLSDVLPTGYMGAEMCDIASSDVGGVGAPARSASSPWTAPGCPAPRRSSPSTRSRTGCRWRNERATRRLTSGRSTFDEADRGFEIFKNKQDNCEKVVLKP
jgi:threonine dehydrogenase-like Zn-dependent dehydrogenase